jgi:hypothetical protein
VGSVFADDIIYTSPACDIAMKMQRTGVGLVEAKVILGEKLKLLVKNPIIIQASDIAFFHANVLYDIAHLEFSPFSRALLR